MVKHWLSVDNVRETEEKFINSREETVDKLKENERIDELGIDGLRIIQNPDYFCFGMDAVLLSWFGELFLKNAKKVLDLGTGTGIVPVLLSGKTQIPVIQGLEIQEELVEMADRSIRLNALENRVHIIQGDIKNLPLEIFPNTYDGITVNPPYMTKGEGIENPVKTKAISRHEIACALDDVIRQASRLLKEKGQFIMIHRPRRLADIIMNMRQYKIEPKHFCFVHPAEGKDANLVLIHGVKCGKPMSKVLPALNIYKHDGSYTKELLEIYRMA